jgi:hypothetical protein
MKAMRVTCVLILVALIAPLAGSARQQQQSTPSGSAQQEEDVREAVFRYQFKTLDFQVAFYFIAVDNKNPSQAFIDRFRENQPIVRGASEAKFEKKPIPGYVDKRTEKQGIMFRQEAIHWNSDSQAEVQGEIECGDLCNPSTGVYHVAREGDHWTVTSFDAGKPRS